MKDKEEFTDSHDEILTTSKTECKGKTSRNSKILFYDVHPNLCKILNNGSPLHGINPPKSKIIFKGESTNGEKPRRKYSYVQHAATSSDWIGIYHRNMHRIINSITL